MSAGGELQLWMSRVLPAPRTEVWRAITDPDRLTRWWGPKGFTVPSIDFDPRAGHSFLIAMQPPEGDSFHLCGEFREVDPPSRLSYTFAWEPPDPEDRETLVTLSLEDRGETTEFSVSQGGFATTARHELHEDGWTDSLDRLEQLLAERTR